MTDRLRTLALLFAAAAFLTAPARAQIAPMDRGAVAGANDEDVAATSALGEVWSGHPVGFDVLARDGHVFVAYYDAERRMTVAHQPPGSARWTRTRLDSEIGWDSHNYLRMTLDAEGYLHLAGNMHVSPLVYFRSQEPYDAESLRRIETMVDESTEQRTTYPRFMRDKQGRLIFRYRNGESGDGNEIYNIYNAETQEWRRLLDEPLTDGEGQHNAYFDGPMIGPDGRWHLAWVWRENADAATNHDLSYAVSDNLQDWETSTGRDLTLPMTLGEAQVVDPVPIRGGLINGVARLGFDHRDRQTITYHKYGDEGHSQIYVARAEEGGEWDIHQISDWEDYRWDFGGGGSIPFDVRVGRVEPDEPGQLAVDVFRRDIGWRTWELDAETLEKTGRRRRETAGLPAGVQRTPDVSVSRPDAQMRMQYRDTHGGGNSVGVRYLISWATLGRNRDRPRDFIPPPSTLKFYRAVEPVSVELSEFAAQQGSGGPTPAPTLTWRTLLENGTQGFALQRRVGTPGDSTGDPAGEWKQVAMVESRAGGSSSGEGPFTYTYEADGLETGAYTFRLVHVGTDGRETVLDARASAQVASTEPSVELASFQAKVASEDRTAVLLMWKTRSETRLRGFEIQYRRRRSRGDEDGDDPQAGEWKKGASVESKAGRDGTGKGPFDYDARIEDLSYGEHVFRLVRVDRSYDETPLPERARVTIGLEASYRVSQVYPNPVRGSGGRSATLEVTVRETQPVAVAFHDALGRQVRRVRRRATLPGQQTEALTVHTDGLASGVYFVRVRGADFTETRHLVVVQ
jgi:hypothetical protein